MIVALRATDVHTEKIHADVVRQSVEIVDAVTIKFLRSLHCLGISLSKNDLLEHIIPRAGVRKCLLKVATKPIVSTIVQQPDKLCHLLPMKAF